MAKKRSTSSKKRGNGARSAKARATVQAQEKAASARVKAAAKSGRPGQRKSRRRIALEWAVTIAAAIAVAWLIQAYLIKPYRVPTPSMADTVAAGDRLLIDRTAFHRHDVGRGDVVTFKGPSAVGGEVLLKRVVGLPGDTLSLRDGKLYVDGRPENGPYIRRVDGVPEPTVAPPEAASAPWSLAKPYTVPAGQYFMMGDNRGDSFDSRYWGPVPRESIIGRAFFAYWPPQRIGGL